MIHIWTYLMYIWTDLMYIWTYLTHIYTYMITYENFFSGIVKVRTRKNIKKRDCDDTIVNLVYVSVYKRSDIYEWNTVHKRKGGPRWASVTGFWIYSEANCWNCWLMRTREIYADEASEKRGMKREKER